MKIGQIEKDIPLPSGRNAQLILYPFAEMEIGDSFLVDIENEKISTVRNRLTSRANHLKKRDGKIFSTRKMNNETSIRVYRIA